jgi:hypothetical protein
MPGFSIYQCGAHIVTHGLVLADGLQVGRFFEGHFA